MQHTPNRDIGQQAPPFTSGSLALTFLLLVVLNILFPITFNSPYPRLQENLPYFFRLFHLYTLYAHLPVIALTALLWFCGLSVGRKLLGFLESEPSAEFLDWPVALAVGWGAIAIGVMTLTFAGQLSAISIAGLLLITLAVSRGECRKLLSTAAVTVRATRRDARSAWSESGTCTRVLIVAALWIAFATFLSGLMPPTQSDGLRYHLTVPKANLQAGGLADLAHLSFSKFPMIVEMLFTIPLAFGLPAGAKLIHLSYFAICLGLIARLSPEGAPRKTAVLLFLTVPFVPFLAAWSFIELGLTAYLLLAWYALRNAFATKALAQRSWLCVSAVAGGLAMGTKYTSVLNHAILCTILLFILEAPLRKRVGVTFLYGLLGALTASPWYIKNWILTGNPVYPLARGLFGSPGWSAADNAFYFYHAGDKGHLNALAEMNWTERLFDLVSLPVRLTALPLPFENFGDWPPGCILLALLPLLFLTLRSAAKLKRLDVLYAVLLFAIWAYTYRDTRFLLPCIAVLTPHIAVLFASLWNHRLFRLALTVTLLSHGVWMTAMWFDMYKYAPWAVVGGKPVLAKGAESEVFDTPVDAYLAAGAWDTYKHYTALIWIRESLPEDAVLYLHGLHTPFYAPRKAIWADWFDTEPLTDAARGGQPPARVVEWLRENGVTHVLHAFGIIAEYNTAVSIPYYNLFSLPESEALEKIERLRALTIVRYRTPKEWGKQMEALRQEITVAARRGGTLKSLESLFDGKTLEPVYRGPFADVLVVPQPASRQQSQ